MPAKAKRTTHRTSKGTKLYAVRSAEGKFKDIQSYKKAHGADLKKTSKVEAMAKATTKVATKVATKAKAKKA